MLKDTWVFPRAAESTWKIPGVEAAIPTSCDVRIVSASRHSKAEFPNWLLYTLSEKEVVFRPFMMRKRLLIMTSILFEYIFEMISAVMVK